MAQIYRGIQLAEGEQLIREYNVGFLKKRFKPKINLSLVVTNRRIIEVGESRKIGGKALLMSDVQIQDVAGFNAILAGGFQILLLIVGILLFIIGIGIIFSNNGIIIGIVGIIGVLIGFILVIVAIVGRGKMLILNIRSRSTQGTPISISVTSTKRGPSLEAIGLGRNVYIKPGPDAEKVIRELSSLIMDLQSDPESALKKWSNYQTQ
ncbi:MAG: hypothetical protein ACP5GR_05740 [Thermoplasmata archaeon]